MSSSPPVPKIDKLTTDGKSYEPAISPDGKLVAYKVIDGDTETIWLRDLAKGSAVQVMPPSAAGYHALAFSPDGSELFYRSYRPGVKNGLVFRVPIFGGTPVEVAREIWSDFGVSPDGKEVAFIRGPGEPLLVVAARTDGGGERVAGRSTAGANWFAMWDSGPVWSPDGKSLALCGGVHGPNGDRAALFEMDAHGGALREIPTPRWASLEQAAWLPGGKALLVGARERGGSTAQIWIVDRDGGRSRRVTNDVSDYRKMKLSADGRELVVEQLLSYQHLWLVRDGDAAPAKQLTSGPSDTDGFYGLSWAPDGRVLFASNRSGEYEIWSMKADGSDARQLTSSSNAPNSWPKATADGRYVVFESKRGGRTRIWRIDADGRNPLQLTRGEADVLPDVSPDGRWVFYTNAATTPSRIEKVAIDGGAAIPLPCDGPCGTPVVSPDGSTIAFDHYDDARGWRTGVMPAAGGSGRFFDWHAYRAVVRWMPGGRSLLYIQKARNLWLQPLDGGAPRPVTRFPQQRVWNAAVSPNGSEFVVVAGDSPSDIVRIRDFR